jgi:hypothetical protein
MADSTIPPWLQNILANPSQSGYYGQSYSQTGSYYDPSTQRWYLPTYERTGMPSQGVEGVDDTLRQTGYAGYQNLGKEGGDAPIRYAGKGYDVYDTNGNQTGQSRFGDPNGPLKGTLSKDGSATDYWKAVAMAVLPALGGAVFGAGSAGAEAGAAGAEVGAGGALAGDATMPGLLGAGNSGLAYGAAIPGLESYALPLAAGAAGGAAGAAGGGGGAATTGGALQGSSAGMSGMAGSNAAFNSAMGGGAGLGAVGAGGGGLSSLVSGAGGTSSLLGAGSTLLGALAGSKGVQSSTTKDIPEWLKPYAQKALGYAGGLLDQQMQPGYLAGYDQMRSVGQGLLNQPIAGNGFSKFFPGK